MDKETIVRNFSRHAALYDSYAHVQKKAAQELLRQTPSNGVARILELGCGTGNYTRLLRNRFKRAEIKAVDICERMISVARVKIRNKPVNLLVGDAEKLDLQEVFDLVTSNASFQWFEDLERALKKYKASLKKGGLISFSIFGPRTFAELKTSIKSALGDNALEADGFLPRENIEKIMLRNFKEAKLKEVVYTEQFKNLQGLLNAIKYTGTRGGGLKNKVYFSRNTLSRINKAYLERYKKITATYQVFFCQGKAG